MRTSADVLHGEDEEERVDTDCQTERESEAQLTGETPSDEAEVLGRVSQVAVN